MLIHFVDSWSLSFGVCLLEFVFWSLSFGVCLLHLFSVTLIMDGVDDIAVVASPKVPEFHLLSEDTLHFSTL